MIVQKKRGVNFVYILIFIILGIFLFILFTNLTGRITSTDSRSGVAIVKTAESGQNNTETNQTETNQTTTNQTNTTTPTTPSTPSSSSSGGSSTSGGGGGGDDYDGPAGEVVTSREPFDMNFDISVRFIEGLKEAYEYQNFTVEREGIVKVTLESGRGLVAKLKIVNTGDVSIKFNITHDVKYLVIDNPVFTLKPNEEIFVVFNFLSPKDEKAGMSYGSIVFNYETGRKVISVVRKVITRSFLEDIPLFAGLPPPFKERNFKVWLDWAALIIAYILVLFILLYLIYKIVKYTWNKIKKVLKIGEYKYLSA